MPPPTVSTGRKSHTPATARPPAADRWPLQDAKARFSELVRKAQDEGPQRVTVHGRESVVVLSVEDYVRLTGARSGQLLVDLLASSPLAKSGADVEFEHAAVTGPVRDVKL
jgi:antitoxin Phd